MTIFLTVTAQRSDKVGCRKARLEPVLFGDASNSRTTRAYSITSGAVYRMFLCVGIFPSIEDRHGCSLAQRIMPMSE